MGNRLAQWEGWDNTDQTKVDFDQSKKDPNSILYLIPPLLHLLDFLWSVISNESEDLTKFSRENRFHGGKENNP